MRKDRIETNDTGIAQEVIKLIVFLVSTLSYLFFFFFFGGGRSCFLMLLSTRLSLRPWVLKKNRLFSKTRNILGRTNTALELKFWENGGSKS